MTLEQNCCAQEYGVESLLEKRLAMSENIAFAHLKAKHPAGKCKNKVFCAPAGSNPGKWNMSVHPKAQAFLCNVGAQSSQKTPKSWKSGPVVQRTQCPSCNPWCAGPSMHPKRVSRVHSRLSPIAERCPLQHFWSSNASKDCKLHIVCHCSVIECITML